MSFTDDKIDPVYKRYRPSKWMSVAGKWRNRNGSEKTLLIEAILFLGVARLMVRTVPFSWIARLIGRYMDDSSRFVSKQEHQLARMIGQAVVSAAGYTPWESVCLPQAMAGQWMLKRRRIPGILYLGVSRDPSKTSGLSAHAWLRCGKLILTGAQGHEKFAVVSTFSTGPYLKKKPSR
jgi:hypothetical protein